MKVGDYVRTNDGCICKVLQYTEISDTDFYVNTDSTYNVVYKSCIVKSSPNIIDLIEVGDYVNGEKVCAIGENSGDVYIRDLQEFILVKDIKSIVTKEMYSSVEYRVENN